MASFSSTPGKTTTVPGHGSMFTEVLFKIGQRPPTRMIRRLNKRVKTTRREIIQALRLAQ